MQRRKQANLLRARRRDHAADDCSGKQPWRIARLLHRSADHVERFSLTRLVAALGIWLFLASLAAFVVDMRDRRAEYQARSEEAEFRRLAQIATAWEVLLTRAGGNIGKGNALNTLVASGQEIVDADLSCKATGIYVEGKCVNPPHYNNVLLSDGDFWADDPDRYVSGALGYIPYLKNVSFKGAVMNNLRAENLFLGSGFSGVGGRNWQVRDMRYAPDGALEVDNIPGYECFYCSFFNSELPFGIYERLTNATLGDVLLVIPSFQADQRDSYVSQWRAHHAQMPYSATSGTHRTFLDSPVVFVNYTLTTNEWGEIFGAWPSLEQGLVDWRMYEPLEYCVTQQDHAALVAYWQDNPPKSNDADIEDAKRGRTGAGSFDPVIVVIDPVSSQQNWKDYFTRDYGFRPWDSVTSSFQAPEARKYLCNFRFEHVEPLLRPRVEEWVRRQLL